MGKDDKEKARLEKEEKARREKEEKEREKREKEEKIQREKEDKEREKREKKERKGQKESVTEKTEDKPVVVKPITKPVETTPAPKSAQKPAEKPVIKPAKVKPSPKPAEKPAPKPAQAKPTPKPAEKPAPKPAQVKPTPKPAEKPAPKPAQAKPTPKPAEKPAPKPAQAKPTPKPAEKTVAKPISKPIEAKPAQKPVDKPADKPVVFKTKISMVGAKPITRPSESKPAVSKPAVPKPSSTPKEPKPVPNLVEMHPTLSAPSTSGGGTQLGLPKWVSDTSIGGTADQFTKKLESGGLKGDEDAALFFKAMIEATKLSQESKKKGQKDFARYIAEDLDQYTDVAYLFEIRGWKEKYVLLFTRESTKLGAWEGKFDLPPVNIGGIKVTNCVFFEMTPSKMLETMKGAMEERLPIASGEVTAIGSVRIAQMFREWTQAFVKFIGQEAG